MGTDPNTDPFFMNEYKECVKKTWAVNLPTNVKVIYYYGNGRKTELVNDEYLQIACEDDIHNSYKKTYLALDFINKKFGNWYDYIFRTNTSTYVHVDNLIWFLSNLNDGNDEQRLFASDIYSLSEGISPYPLCLYPRGNGILLSKWIVQNIILKEGFRYLYMRMSDDIALGNVINSYHIQCGETYTDYIKGLPHTWYRAVDKEFNCGHSLSTYCSSKYYEVSVTTTLKRYRERDKEFEIYHEFHQKLANREFNQDPNLLYGIWSKYVDDFPIFIGSILGYISFDKWKSMDKNKLYLMEISNKASDDDEFYKFREIQGKFKQIKNGSE